VKASGERKEKDGSQEEENEGVENVEPEMGTLW
jgi:hypothetical protein